MQVMLRLRQSALAMIAFASACAGSPMASEAGFERRCQDAQRSAIHGTFPSSFSASFIEQRDGVPQDGLPCSVDCELLLRSQRIRTLYVRVQRPDPTYGYPADSDKPNSINRVVNAAGIWSYTPKANDFCETRAPDRGFYYPFRAGSAQSGRCAAIASANHADADAADVQIQFSSRSETEGEWDFTMEGITASQGGNVLFRETSVQQFRVIGGVPQTEAQCFVPARNWTQVLAEYIDTH